MMTNPVQRAAIPERADSIARGLGQTDGRYGSWFDRRYRPSGHLWQKRFYSCALGRTHLLAAFGDSPVTDRKIWHAVDGGRWRRRPVRPWSTFQARPGPKQPFPGGRVKAVAGLSPDGHYIRRLVHRFDRIETNLLQLQVLATNGARSARVYEVRVYKEA